MGEQQGLAAEVALLWGLREPPRRGPKATLTADDIIRAAVAIADADGLAAVSMARVADRLGNSPMALYRHVRSKDELLSLMTDAALESPPDLTGVHGWRAGLTAWARGIVDVNRRHPWLARLPISGPPVGPHNLAWFDSALGTLDGTGLAAPERLAVVMGLLTYVQGEVRLTADLAVGYAADPAAFGRAYGEALARVVDPRTLPALAAILDEGVFEDAGQDFEGELDADFDFGLACYLDGVAAFIARTGAH